MSVKTLNQTDLGHVRVPAWVRAVAKGRTVEPVWRNEDGGVTFRIADGAEYLKLQQPGIDWHPDEEAARLAWVNRYVPAPQLLGSGRRGAAHWLHTSGLPGRSAVEAPWRDRPDVAVPQLGRALRRFHDEVPAADCPFDWSIDYRVRRYRLDERFAAQAPPLDPVVCHGDACNPNFLLDDDGHFSGYVDLGGLGVADRWADLAPALLSLGWNYGPGWDRTLLDAYGIELDEPKRRFYTALWNGVGDELGRGNGA